VKPQSSSWKTLKKTKKKNKRRRKEKEEEEEEDIHAPSPIDLRNMD